MTANPALSPSLRITGGRVIDPARGPSCIRDVLIAGRRIVDELPVGEAAPPVRTIDATGKLVLAGGIDPHSHLVSRGVALAREVGEDPSLAPSPRRIGQGYLRMGYTTVLDAAVPPGEGAHARAEVDAIGDLEVRFLVEMGSHPPLLEHLARSEQSAATELMGELLETTGAYGIKLVNPGLTDRLDEPIPNLPGPLTPMELIRACGESVERLKLPHPVHVHVPGPGRPGNVNQTVRMLQAMEGCRLHLAHAQFSAYGRAAGGGFTSGASRLASALSRHSHVTADTGCIGWGPAMMITRDRLLAQRLGKVAGLRITSRHGWSVAPMEYAPANPIHALQWAIGLELVLQSPRLDRLALSVDHPNGGPFTALPTLVGLLTNRERRETVLHACHAWAGERNSLSELDRELTEQEAVMLTRTAPANALGLTRQGHLGIGADADVVVAQAVDAWPEVVIKAGRVVVGGEEGMGSGRMNDGFFRHTDPPLNAGG